MCLAIPGKIVELLDDSMGIADFGGITRSVSLFLVPEARVGEYVNVHAGTALIVIDEKAALATIEILEQLGEVAEETGDDNDNPPS